MRVLLLGQLSLGRADLDMLTIQLTAALDGPVLIVLDGKTYLIEAASGS